MTFPGILFSVKGSEIKACYEAKAMEKIVHLKETSDKYAEKLRDAAGHVQQYLRGDIAQQAREDRAASFQQFKDRTEHEANRLRILADHIESDRIYYLTESQLTEIGLLPGLR